MIMRLNLIKEPGCTSEYRKKALLDRTEGLKTSLTWSQGPEVPRPERPVPPSFPVREEVNLSQRRGRERGRADVAVAADPGDEEIEGRDPEDGDRGRGLSEARGLAAGKDPTGLEAGAEAETDASPKAARDEVSPDLGPMREAGRRGEATRMPSLLFSRKYQV